MGAIKGVGVGTFENKPKNNTKNGSREEERSTKLNRCCILRKYFLSSGIIINIIYPVWHIEDAEPALAV